MTMQKNAECAKDNVVAINLVIATEYVLTSSLDSISADENLNKAGLSDLAKPIINLPDGQKINTNSKEYTSFIEAVNKIDELLELHDIDICGEGESEARDSESIYRKIILNTCKNTNGVHYSIKTTNILRFSTQNEAGSTRRRNDRFSDTVPDEKSENENNGEAANVDELQSIVIETTISDPSKANIANKEFDTYKDLIQYVDEILDSWGL